MPSTSSRASRRCRVREEQLKLLNPTEGPFRLRGREELEKFLNEQEADLTLAIDHLLQHQEARNNHRKPIGFAE